MVGPRTGLAFRQGISHDEGGTVLRSNVHIQLENA